MPDTESDTSPVVADYSVLHRAPIEKVFTDCVYDHGRFLVFDSVEVLPDGFRVHSHDLYGPLPDIVIGNSGDTFLDKERLGYGACKLTAVVKLSDQMVVCLPGGEFLPPTSMNGKAVVGFQAQPKTWIAEGKDFLEAYHDLHSQIV